MKTHHLSHPVSDAAPSVTPKKSYRMPELQRYGRLSHITLAGSTGMNEKKNGGDGNKKA